MENKLSFNFDAISENYSKMINLVRAGNSCSIFGVQNSMRTALVSNFQKKILYLTADNVSANSLLENLKMMGQKALLLPSVPDLFIYKKAGSTELYKERSKTLFQILKGDYDFVVAPIEALFQILPNQNEFYNNIINLKTGNIIEPKT